MHIRLSSAVNGRKLQSGRSGKLLLRAMMVWLALAGAPRALAASDHDAAWLRYAQIDDKNIKELYAAMPAVVVALGDSPIVRSAQEEMVLGVRGMLGRTLRAEAKLPEENAIILGTYDVVSQAVPAVGKMADLRDDGYWIRSVDVDGAKHLVVTAPNERGVLYGTFALLRKITLRQPIAELSEQQSPAIPLRLISHHDRLDGTVAAGYAGPSIFWEAGHFTPAPERVRDYARLLASIGINAIALNEASSGVALLSPEGTADLAKAADALRAWGLRVFVAIDADDVRQWIGVSANDSIDERASAALKQKIDELYKAAPDLGGVLLSDEINPAREVSAQIANAVASALATHDGVLIYRPTPDGANAEGATVDPMTAFMSLRALDGQLSENVILDIPAWPARAHLRQAPSPLFGALEKTASAIEFDITQQFVGEQRHLVFLVPAWKAALDFDLKATDKPTPVKTLIKGGRGKEEGEEPAEGAAAPSLSPSSAFIARVNIGRDPNWLRDPLAMANLFGFGRLAWNPDLAGKAIAEDWARLTFGHDPLVVGTVVELLLESSQLYENYTGPLGLGTLTDVAQLGYGPSVEASGGGNAFHLRADETGVGVDRTTASGSGFVGQYRPEVAKLFESLETCPEELVLFVHHLAYTHRLKSGKTVIQQIYNSLYAGAEGAARMAEKWRALEGKIDDGRFRLIQSRLNYQAGHAQAWRDALANWFLRKSGIADDEGRVGNYPGRIEAEAMTLEGYEAKNVTPWEAASGGQCAESTAPTGKGAMSFKYEGEPGWVDLKVRYFDENDGASQFELLVAGEVVDRWKADDMLPDNQPSGNTSTRHITRSIALRKGDEIRLEATSDGSERAAVDYIEFSSVKP